MKDNNIINTIKQMPKEKPLTKTIPKIYKRNAESISLLSFVRAQKQIVPTVTLDQAIMNFFREFGISMDDWDIESARTTYNRMQKDFFDDCKNSKNSKKVRNETT